MAYVTAPDGRQGEVPDEELQGALAAGYKPREPAPEELARAEASKHPVQAGLEAAGRAIVPGIGTEIIANINAQATGQQPYEAMQEQQLRKEENPVSAMVGTGVGFAVGPGKVLGGVTKGLRASGLAGRAVAGMSEGGVMGLSEAVNDSILENVPLTAENLAANAMGGALAGGALDFGMGAIGKGVSALVKKAGGVGVRETLKKMSDKVLTAELGTKSLLKQRGTAENMSEILDFGRKNGILTPATTFQTGLEASTREVEKLKPVYDAILDTLDETHPPQKAAAAILGDVEKSLKQFKGGLLAPQAESVLAEIRTVTEGPDLSWRVLHKLQSSIAESMPSGGETNALSSRRVWSAVSDTLTNSVKNQIDDGLGALAKSGKMHPELVAQGLGSGSAIKDLSREYYYASRLEAMFKDRAAASAVSGLGMKDMMAGGAGAAVLTGHPMAAVGALATSAASKLARERGGFVVGGALHALSESGMLEGVANSFKKIVDGKLAGAPELLGSFRGMLEQASAQGAEDLLQTHVDLAHSSNGQEYMARMGMLNETPEEVSGMGVRLANISALKEAAAQHQMQVDGAVDGLFGSAKGRKGTVGSAFSAKDLSNTMKNIRGILDNPEGVFERAPAEVYGSAPGVVGSAGGVLLQAARFLDSKAPKSPYVGMPEAVAPRWEPSAAELDRFNQYREAVESPAKALKNMAQGHISQEQVDAIKAVYPAMYSELQQKITERLAMAKKPLSYQQQLALAAIVGPSALGMSPQQAQILQMAHAQRPSQGPPPSAKKDGRQEVDAAKNQQTQAQRLEAR